ncbi:hypothetical protein LguiA_006378 [Lonicera macranthoides]
MLLGKRARPPMKRNTSMTEFTLDFTNVAPHPSDPHNPFTVAPTTDGPFDQRFLDPPPPPPPAVTVSPRNRRRNSSDFAADSSHFLRSCSLCKRRLVPGRDIYMYRGDSAFCSLECRQQQIIQDERKEKLCSSFASTATAVSEVVSTNGEAPTVTAL